jgi:hypothetical protein
VTNRLEEIARRKQALIDKAGRERAELAAAWDRMRSPFDVTSTIVGIGRTLRTHPIIAAGISSFLVSGYAGRLLKSAAEVLKLWKLTRPIWHWWRTRRKSN